MEDKLNQNIKEDELNKKDLDDTVDLKYITEEIEKLKAERIDDNDNSK
ncbi:MAG: hypothetical protein GX758_05060 [Tenericutes bacterium]|nr:hypothetical protein [Mycoplasmatota bacterium]